MKLTFRLLIENEVSRLPQKCALTSRDISFAPNDIALLSNGLSPIDPFRTRKNAPTKSRRSNAQASGSPARRVNPKDIPIKFAHEFTSSPIHLTCGKSERQLKRQFHLLPLTGHRPSRLTLYKKRSYWPNSPQPWE